MCFHQPFFLELVRIPETTIMLHSSSENDGALENYRQQTVVAIVGELEKTFDSINHSLLFVVLLHFEDCSPFYLVLAGAK